MLNQTYVGKVNLKPLYCAIFCVLVLLVAGCSGPKGPEQPFLIPFDSNFITTDRALSVSPSLSPDGSNERSFLSITRQTYFFENSNSTAQVQILLNRKATVTPPEIGEWSTVSTGNCLSDSDDVQCFTAHIDCHLVRTTFIPTGERSLTIIKVRNRAREPQELCEQWDHFNLTDAQREEVKDFNSISDSFFTYEVTKETSSSVNQTNSE